jgi:hypothetical protein
MPKKLAVGSRKPSAPRKPSTPKRELIEIGKKKGPPRTAKKR